MLALLYLISFLTGAVATVVVQIIIKAYKQKKESASRADDGYINVLNY